MLPPEDFVERTSKWGHTGGRG
jgi:hypothetical protein